MNAEEPFIWTKDVEVGIPEIDEQHKQIFRLLDMSSSASSKEDLDYILTQLSEYSTIHIATEETLLDTPGLYEEDYVAYHKEEHRFFSEKVNYFLKKFHVENKTWFMSELFSFLKSWIRQHVIKVDMKLKR